MQTFSKEDLQHNGMAPAAAARWWQDLQTTLRGRSAAEGWKALVNSKLLEQLPLGLHESCFQYVYADHDESKLGPRMAWHPGRREMESSNLAQAVRERGFKEYCEFFQWSVRDRAGFWKWSMDKVGVVFEEVFDQVLDDKRGPHHPNWLVGASLNIAKSCFTAPKEKVALTCVSESGTRVQWTYGELEARAQAVAASLVAQGHNPGERFAVFMPMNAESVAIYLGVVLFGGAIVSIADSFSTEEINTRLRISEASTVFTQDGMWRAGKFLDLYSRIAASTAKKAIVLSAAGGKRPQVSLRPEDCAWENFLQSGQGKSFEARSMSPRDVSNVLFSSGTTGDPKAIPWTHTTPIKAAVDGYYHQDITAQDSVCWPTNLGWMMGPWLIYATLVNQARLVLFDGGTQLRAFGEFIQNEKVTVLGLVPSIVKQWKEARTMEGLDWSSIKCFSSTGECSNAQDYLYLMALAGYRPVIEYCGGTEIGGAYITCTLVQPQSPATFSTPALGLDFEILDEEGRPAEQGELFLAPPSIGLSETLLNRDHDEVYAQGVPEGRKYPVLRRHGDQVEAVGRGYYRALGRADDTMNLGGIKVSSAEIERVANRAAEVLETAAIAVNPPGGGPSLLVIFACLKKGAAIDAKALQTELQKRIRADLNPLFKIHEVVVTDKLPRTASNKVMRRVLRKQYESSAER